MVILFVNTLLQGIAAGLLLDGEVNYLLSGIRLVTDFEIVPGQFWSTLSVIITPVLSSIIFIEIGMFILFKRTTDKMNISFVVFQLINIGYIITIMIIGIVSIVFHNSMVNDFRTLLNHSGYTYNQQLLYMLVAAVLMFSYINFIFKRMSKNLPAIIQNKNKK